MKAKRLAKIGRTRKTGPREPNGRLARAPKPEREDEIMSVALAQRKRLMPRKTPNDTLRDQRAGDVFGRLLLSAQISPAQHAAGIAWRDAFLAYASVTGTPLPFPVGTLAKIGYIRGVNDNDFADDTANGIKRRFRDLDGALRDNREGQQYREALASIILMDHQPGDLVMGYLREALNVINRRCVDT